MARKKIGALLEEKGYITEFQLVAALSHQRKWKTKLGQSLIELGYLEENQLYEVLADQLGLEFLDPRKIKIPAEVMKNASKDLAKEWQAIPVAFDGRVWTIAVAEAQKPGLMEKLATCFRGEIKLCLATTLAIESLARKIPERVPVAAVQPVKKAFVKDQNGMFTPLEGKTSPTPPPKQADADLFLDSPAETSNESFENLEMLLDEPVITPDQEPAPAGAPMDDFLPDGELPPLPGSPLPEEAPSVSSAPAEPPGIELPPIDVELPPADVDLPPEEVPGLMVEREPEAEPAPEPGPGEEQIPLEAAHESAANISMEEPRDDASDMIDLDELMPPPDSAGLGAEKEGEGGQELQELSAPPLEEPPIIPDIAKSEAAPAEASMEMPAAEPEIPETVPPLESGEAEGVPPLEEAPLEMPGEESEPGSPPSIRSDDSAFANQESEEETFMAPPLETETGPLAEPPAPALEEAAPRESIEAPSLPSLEDLTLQIPTAANEPAGADSSFDVPSLDDLLVKTPGADEEQGAEKSAPGPGPVSSAEAEQAQVGAETEGDIEAPPLSDLKPADTSGDEVTTLDEVVEPELEAPAEASSEAEPEEAEEDTQELMERIKALESQIQGMTEVLKGFKKVIKDKDARKKGKQ